MCGQTGIILGTAKRDSKELKYFSVVFERLLLLNQKRGHHATGIATVDLNCGYQLLKRPMEAVRFTALAEYRGACFRIYNRILRGKKGRKKHIFDFSNSFSVLA
jgi:hypothetical protein